MKCILVIESQSFSYWLTFEILANEPSGCQPNGRSDYTIKLGAANYELKMKGKTTLYYYEYF